MKFEVLAFFCRTDSSHLEMLAVNTKDWLNTLLATHCKERIALNLPFYSGSCVYHVSRVLLTCAALNKTPAGSVVLFIYLFVCLFYLICYLSWLNQYWERFFFSCVRLWVVLFTAYYKALFMLKYCTVLILFSAFWFVLLSQQILREPTGSSHIPLSFVEKWVFSIWRSAVKEKRMPYIQHSGILDLW